MQTQTLVRMRMRMRIQMQTGYSNYCSFQMQVQMLCPFAEGNGVYPITSGEVLHKDTGSLNGPTPVGGFLLVERKRAGAMAQAVQKHPANQWRRIGVMAKHPEMGAFNFVVPHHGRLDMQSTDGTVGVHHRDDTGVLMSLFNRGS